ncbi:MAG: hypothetical protein KME64_15705 [Scytonematopsis contorta HA4267-MV1]|jgi:hypothetical protein|nr:hypothetical protein [Scytonematopsis contorta HA4267-MV1]
MTTKKSQCDWNAWYDTMPGSNPTLHVTGKCTFPSDGYSVKLEQVEVGTEPPGILQLRYIVEPPKGIVPQVITVEEARYNEDTNVVYKEVQILPDNIKIPVEQVFYIT